MKTLILSLSLILYINCYSQQNSWFEQEPKGMKFICNGSFEMPYDKEKKIITVQPFWMSNEISNQEYREFLEYMYSHQKDTIIWFENSNNNFKAMKKKPITGLIEIINVDSFAMSKQFAINSEKYKEYKNYFTASKFNIYPVVGVSFEGAFYYCKWKTQMENKTKPKEEIQDYRLPSFEEWTYAALLSGEDKKAPENIIKPVDYNKHKMTKLSNFNTNVSEYIYFLNSEKKYEEYIIGGSFNNENRMNFKQKININERRENVGFRVVRSYIGKNDKNL